MKLTSPNIPEAVGRRLAGVAILLAVLPTAAVTVTYFIAAREGFVDWCIPFWDSCTSISATARQGLAFYLFKLTMVPMALLYWFYWRQCGLALGNPWQTTRNNLTVLGGIAALALLAYVLALGLAGHSLQLTRRIGIILFFAFTYLCQLLVVRRQMLLTLSAPAQRWQQFLLALILLVGLLSLVLDVLMSDYDLIEDAFEWNLALLLHINFLLASIGWRQLSRPEP